MESSNKSFFDAIPSKTSFLLGFATAILCMGTVGFVLLGSCVMNGSCPTSLAAADVKTGTTKTTTTTTPTPTAAPTAASVPVVTDEDHVRGSENAELTIIEYSDFQCPFCSRFHPVVQQAMDDYDGQIRWVYRHFPLSFHPEAEPAAEAAECAGEQDKFWEYADALFTNQTTLGADLYTKLASDLGLNTTKFADCLASDRMLEAVRADMQGGSAAGVTGTPGSFLIDADGNAQPIKGALPYASVQAMIDAALAS